MTMKGPLAMLTGKGEREYKNSHDEFDRAIPNRFPFRAGDVVRTGPGDMDIRDLRPGDERLPLYEAARPRFNTRCWKNTSVPITIVGSLSSKKKRKACWNGYLESE
jgi:hypothetical protein